LTDMGDASNSELSDIAEEEEEAEVSAATWSHNYIQFTLMS